MKSSRKAQSSPKVRNMELKINKDTHNFINVIRKK